jgi:hypothetical protein
LRPAPLRGSMVWPRRPPEGTMLEIIAVVVVVGLLYEGVSWLGKKKDLGTIRCRRCGHTGPAQGLFQIGRGVRAVCEKCQSEDWSTVGSRR